MAYCRIDVLEDGEEDLLKTLYLSAVAYLAGADISEPEADTPRRAQYDLCVNFMVLRDFDLREATITGTIVNDNPAFRRLLTQLKLTEPMCPSWTHPGVGRCEAMADYIDAGKLNKAAQVLELRETAPGVWEWVPARRTWASITLQPKTNLFSKVGIGARNAP